MNSLRENFLVVVLSALIAFGLGISLWDMNFWPTDAEVYYMPAVKEIAHLPYISQIHLGSDETRVRWLHGKEMLLLCLFFAQRLFNDFSTLRPFLIVELLSLFFCLISVFFIARNYWGRGAGWICYLFFSTCFWPYLYVLFVKHQLMGLGFVLLSIFCIQTAQKKGVIYYLGSAIALGLALFSSPTVPVYFPFWLAAFGYAHWQGYEADKKAVPFLKKMACSCTLIILGSIFVLIYFTYPDVFHNIKGQWEYVMISKKFNHSYYNQPVLVQWFPGQDLQILRGGWVWVVRFLVSILPVLFPAYLSGIIYLLFTALKGGGPSLTAVCFMIFLSLAPVLMGEAAGIGQIGGNFFPVLTGMVVLIGYSLFVLLRSGVYRRMTDAGRKVLWVAFSGILLVHAAVNIYFFCFDVYPTRMVMTFLSKKIKELGITHLYSYPHHPLISYFTDTMSPDVLSKMKFTAIKSVAEPQEGFILLPPITGDTIYRGMTNHGNDFDLDIFLNEIVRQGKLSDYAVASFPTMASSRIWPREEEILSYRGIILGHFKKTNPDKQKVWLLDAGKIHKDIALFLPSKESLMMIRSRIRNIGTRTKVYMYPGNIKSLSEPQRLTSITERIYKVGNPPDALVAYLYKLDKVQPVWVPADPKFASLPVEAKNITADSQGEAVVFHFPKALTLPAGQYQLVIYRTGQADDENFYRIKLNP